MKWVPLILVALLSWLAYERTDGFSPMLIAKPLVSAQDDLCSVEAMAALNQPYRYLSRGRQSFVFESLDGKFVLKFFNSSYLNLSRNKEKRQQRRRFFKESYLLAWKELKQETGLLHLHQGFSLSRLPRITLTNRIGCPFVLDLNEAAFVLQKKGEPFGEALPRIFAAEGILGVERVIDLWFSFVDLRLEKQIVDKDVDAILNFGLCDGALLNLDPGRFCFDEALDQQAEWIHSSRHFRKWLVKNYPEATAHFDQELKERSSRPRSEPLKQHSNCR